MSNTYTEFLDKYIEAISDDEPEISTVLATLDKLRESDDYKLSFSDRFSKLISEKGNLPYSLDAIERKNMIPSYRDYLLSLYKEKILPYETNNDVEKNKILGRVRKNISNWLSDGDGNSPSSANKSRDLLYKICFSLNLSFDETEWFFNHLCFQRCFNLHLKNEIIYYYCFNNKLDFKKASLLLAQIKTLELPTHDSSQNNLFTHQVLDVLEKKHSDEELIDFFYSHYDFVSSKEQNRSAKEQYCWLYQNLKPNANDATVSKDIKSFIDNHRQDLNIEISDCSPFIFEQLVKITTATELDPRIHITEAEFLENPNRHKDIKELYNFFYNQSIFTDAFLLRCIYGSQDIDVEKINFFPSQKTLSNLNKVDLEYTTQYHNLRKCLILYYFFYYWLILKEEKPSLSAYQKFLFELNDILITCGYETLYSGNAYDQVFLVCSKSEDPIDTFRTFIKHYLEKQ